MRRKAKRMWAYLLVLLLLFSVAGGSGFPVLAETEHIEDVSTEAENMETAEMEAGETEAEEKAGKQDEQAEEQQQGDSGSDENTGKDTGKKDPDENTETVAPGENNEAENPETTEKEQKAGNLEAGSEADDAEVMETVLPEEELVARGASERDYGGRASGIGSGDGETGSSVPSPSEICRAEPGWNLRSDIGIYGKSGYRQECPETGRSSDCGQVGVNDLLHGRL